MSTSKTPREIWIQAAGQKIPNGFSIFFLDGNRYNKDITNMALVSAETLRKIRPFRLIPRPRFRPKLKNTLKSVEQRCSECKKTFFITPESFRKRKYKNTSNLIFCSNLCSQKSPARHAHAKAAFLKYLADVKSGKIIKKPRAPRKKSIPEGVAPGGTF